MSPSSFHAEQALIVTTSLKAPPPLIARAQLLAARCGGRYLPRKRGISRHLTEADAQLAYIVTHERESLKGQGSTLFMHAGLFYLKASQGLEHPVFRALAPPEGSPPASLVDGTLGLGGDAFHIASLLEISILGIEVSPILYSLVEEGLQRLGGARRRWAGPAESISLRCGDARAILATLPDGGMDAVYLDPMFDVPADAQPGFDLLRLIADHRPLNPELLQEAVRVARLRVVVKVRCGAPPPHPSAPGPGWNRWVRGTAVDYYIIDKELEGRITLERSQEIEARRRSLDKTGHEKEGHQRSPVATDRPDGALPSDIRIVD